MGRLLVAFALVAGLAGCKLDPAGTCSSRADCSAGLDCLNGVCAACRGDTDCQAWQSCGQDGLCTNLAGRCGVDGDCDPWDVCDATHTCVLSASVCPNLTCAALEICDPSHTCSLADGRCTGDADCHAWLAGCDVPTNGCLLPATAGEDVLAIGTLVDGDCSFGAVSRATTAAASDGVEIGLGCGSADDGRGAVDPVTGGLVYRRTEPLGGDTLRRFRRDALTRDTLWRFPADPSVNDDHLLAPGACPLTWDRWVMQADSGLLLYGCPIGGTPLQRDFYDAGDAKILPAVREVLSWSTGGSLLVISSSGAIQVVDVSGATPVATTVTGLPAGTPLAQRGTATGFLLALHDDSTGVDERYAIDELSAVATYDGDFAGVSGAYAGAAWSALDAAGTLYGGAFLGAHEVLIKRPLAPGTSSVVYDEAAQPAGSDDFTATTFVPFLRLDRFLLVTRP